MSPAGTVAGSCGPGALCLERDVFDASTRWLARLRCEKGESMVVSGSTAVV